MATYTLYKKTHTQTGLKYLGYTSRDPILYEGSGTYWQAHIKKHGYNVDTEILFQTTNKEEIPLIGSYYSQLWNIVEERDTFGKKVWANLKPESGDGGWYHINSNKEHFTKKISDWWNNLSLEDQKIINSKKSLPGKLNGMYGRDRSGPLGPNYGKSIWDASDKKRIGDMNKGMVGVKHSITGEVIGQVSVNDPNYLNGAWVHCAVGFNHSEEFKKKRSDEWKLRKIRPPSPKGKLWWNNGSTQVRGKVSPGPEWVRGRLKKIQNA
jgi:hypothetical protein